MSTDDKFNPDRLITTPRTLNEVYTAIVTECCSMAIGPDCRYCPKCGQEARVERKDFGRICERGVDGSAGCGHSEGIDRGGQCIHRLEGVDPNLIAVWDDNHCGHRCDSPSAPPTPECICHKGHRCERIGCGLYHHKDCPVHHDYHKAAPPVEDGTPPWADKNWWVQR